MTWLAGALAGAAVAGLAWSWWRRRRAIVPPDAWPRIQPTRGSQPAGVAGERPLMPPPAPIASALPDRDNENRAMFRRAGNATVIQVADDNERHRPFDAWVIDRSRHGLRFAADRALTVGQKYAVRPVQATPATPWCVIEIRHCTATDGHWEVGCRFLQPPPVRLLMLFG